MRAHRIAAALAAGALSIASGVRDAAAAPLPGGSLDPTAIDKYQAPLFIPPAMPASTSDATVDYQIAVRQFTQQVLPPGLPETTVWGYGSIDDPGSFHYPSATIEATAGVPLKVKWINDLKDPLTGEYLPHLLPVDQTLHWANPPQDCAHGMTHTDCRGSDPAWYTGPVPIVTHVHGAHVAPESDGHPEAWYLPDAGGIPASYARRGSKWGQSAGAPDVAGQAIFTYPNDQRATTLWYHDHTLGMTRVNVYAGPAGFYLLRGGVGDQVEDRKGRPATLPGGDHEIPIVIQDRSFNSDGSLFYPGSREFFDGYAGPYLPDPSSDVSPTWNPEFFGNTMVVNGRTWPYLEVEPRRYRFRILNGSDSRFLILTATEKRLAFWQIGADGGFLRAPVALSQLLVGPAERADVIVDFARFAPGTRITLLNVGPDEPFGGGTPGVDFERADPGTTGQVMEFRVVAGSSPDTTTPPSELVLPDPLPLGPPRKPARRVSLNEDDSAKICVDGEDQPVICATDPAAVAFFGPVSARLGTLDADGFPEPRSWMDEVSENPALGSTEVWEIYNFTADAHPIHIHLVQFEVLDRQPLVTDAEGMSAPPARLAGKARPPEPWETGRKDTVIVYPGERARVKALFDIPGEYVWHCHILSHEDNEMMRPYRVGP